MKEYFLMHKLNSKAIPVIIAGFCWGLISVFVNPLSTNGFDSFQIMELRIWISTIVMFLFLLIYKSSLLKIKIKDLWMFIGTGIFSFTFFSICYFTTIINSGAAVAVVLLYTSPVFVMLLSALFFREKITSKKIIVVIMTLAGSVMVAGLLGGSTRLSTASFFIGVGAGVGYALYSIFAGFAVKKYSSLTITFYTFLLASIALLFIQNPINLFSTVKGADFPYVAGLSLVSTVIPYILYTIGLRSLEKSKAAVIVMVEPLVGTIYGICFLHESCDVWKILGIVLIFFAILYLEK